MNIQIRKDILSVLTNPFIPLDNLFRLSVNISPTRTSLFQRLYQGVGNTPFYYVNLLNSNSLYLKKETENANGNNHYSRYWIIYLFIMEEIGEISPDSTHLIEVSSGSSGISLSIACKELGYPLTMILPEILPIRRVEPMIRNGASIIYSKGYVRECIGLLKRKLVSRKFFYPNHSEEENDIIVKVFKRITAEIYNQAEFDYLISGIGNGSSTVALFDFIFKTKIHKIGFFPFANSNKIVYGLYGQMRNYYTLKGQN